MMTVVGFIAIALLIIVLIDTFETMLLPRRVKRQFSVCQVVLPLFLEAVGPRQPG